LAQTGSGDPSPSCLDRAVCFFALTHRADLIWFGLCWSRCVAPCYQVPRQAIGSVAPSIDDVKAPKLKAEPFCEDSQMDL
jgi:hypothetical protein